MAGTHGRGGFVTLLLVLTVGCGGAELAVQTEAGSPSMSEVVGPVGSSPGVGDAVPDQGDVVVTLSAPSKSGSTDQQQVIRKAVDSPSLRVSIDLPADAVDDPLDDPIMPDWVMADDRWFIDGCCRIIVVLQIQRPLFADDAHIVSIDAAGLTWDLYEKGPRDGTILAATATDGDVSFVISIQELFPDRVSDQSPLDILSAVVDSVVLERL